MVWVGPPSWLVQRKRWEWTLPIYRSSGRSQTWSQTRDLTAVGFGAGCDWAPGRQQNPRRGFIEPERPGLFNLLESPSEERQKGHSEDSCSNYWKVVRLKAMLCPRVMGWIIVPRCGLIL